MDFYLSQIIYWACNFAPRGWAFCSGQMFQISQFTALFSLLGNTFGGDGRTTFALPDLRGRVPVGSTDMGQAPGLQGNYQRGAKGGVETITLTTAEIPSHNHNVNLSTDEAARVTPQPNDVFGGGITSPDFGNGTPVKMYGPANNITNGPDVSNTGDNQPHENRMPYESINACMCVQGLFPSRN